MCSGEDMVVRGKEVAFPLSCADNCGGVVSPRADDIPHVSLLWYFVWFSSDIAK